MDNLIKKAEKIKGRVLVIGFKEESKIVRTLNNNKNITELVILTNDEKKPKGKKKSFLSGKKVNIKRLYKELKKDRYDYLIYDFNCIISYLRKFIKNSIKISDNIYIYSKKMDYDIKELKYRYSRYNCVIKDIEVNENLLLEINNKNVKFNFIKSIGYYFKDMAYDIIEFIANIMIG